MEEGFAFDVFVSFVLLRRWLRLGRLVGWFELSIRFFLQTCMLHGLKKTIMVAYRIDRWQRYRQERRSSISSRRRR